MTSSLKNVSIEEDLVVSLEEAKTHLRVDVDDDDDMIEAMIEAATDFVDGPGSYLGRAVRDQTWDYYVDTFPSLTDPNPGFVEIPLPPLQEVSGVFYNDSSGAEQEFDSASYTVDSAHEPGRILLPSSGSWPTTDTGAGSVRIRFRAGYVDITQSPPLPMVPPTIKQAILLLVGNMYANRESVVVGTTAVQITMTVEYLLKKYRFYLGMA